MSTIELIEKGHCSLGIELGSTRVKAILIDLEGHTLATGIYDWENSFLDGIWTYKEDEIKTSLKACFKNLKQDVFNKYKVSLKKLASLGISGMMHGYIALDKDKNIIAPFYTWRNTNTQESADYLTNLFNFNIPLRWSCAHVYQRILEKDSHLNKLDYVCTLSAYIHYLLTDEKVLGVGDASGMFPINDTTHDYDSDMKAKFDNLLKEKGYNFTLDSIFPKVLVAGERAGTLTKSGALLLDESGELECGIPLCPPEGDAGTGMVATNAVAPRTGNISAGTSIFAMIVLEHSLSKLHREIDMVMTPDGYPCAMSHANNGTTDLNALVHIFKEFTQILNIDISDNKLYESLYNISLSGDKDCGGILPYNYYSGENITMINEGRPILLRSVNSNFNLANLMRSYLYTSLAAVALGLDILFIEEKVKLDKITGHGGLFKTKVVGQTYMSAALKAPVAVMETASEGGAYGIAVLALFLHRVKEYKDLASFLNELIFKHVKETTISASKDDIQGFEVFKERYKKALDVQKTAISCINW